MKLLLAEDEVSLSKALVKILEKNHHSVEAVYDGRSALDYIEMEDFDAIILDIMMPEMNGIEVLKNMRSAGNQTPVIMLTAKSEIQDKIEGLDTGANDYLTKPFDSRELMARLRAITRSPEAVNSTLTFGNISLDRATFELSSPSGSFKLTNKEFQIMETLMSSPKKLVSTDRFMEKIWGFDSEAEVNVVWVYISYLRKKLTALEADVHIKAARNAGYSLEIMD